MRHPRAPAGETGRPRQSLRSCRRSPHHRTRSLGACSEWPPEDHLRRRFLRSDEDPADLTETTTITLRTEADAIAAELPSAQIANLITLLAASLHNDDDHRVEFQPPHERSKKETRKLHEAACRLYDRWSFKRHETFDRFVEENRHFGTMRKFTVGDHMSQSVARECDPKLENMPFFVRGIEYGLDRNSNRFAGTMVLVLL